jgi:hypothetical protein
MMMNQTPDRAQRPGRVRLLRVPRFRLLAINLAVGVTLAAPAAAERPRAAHLVGCTTEDAAAVLA